MTLTAVVGRHSNRLAGGRPSGRTGLALPGTVAVSAPRASQGRTKEQLYNEAKQRGIKGRSSMSKAELERALSK